MTSVVLTFPSETTLMVGSSKIVDELALIDYEVGVDYMISYYRYYESFIVFIRINNEKICEDPRVKAILLEYII